MSRISHLQRLAAGFLACVLVGTFLLAQDRAGNPGGSDGTRAVISQEVRELLERIQAQESAAATEAESIRQLQANSNIKPDEAAMAEHQGKLQKSLGAAFDLKQKLDEVQVEELRSRLNLLERQIDQRKNLREKIIQRRATELVEGSATGWDPPGIVVTQPSAGPPGASQPQLELDTEAIRYREKRVREHTEKFRTRVAKILEDVRRGNAQLVEAVDACKQLAKIEPLEAAKHWRTILDLNDALLKADAISDSEHAFIEAELSDVLIKKHVRDKVEPQAVASNSPDVERKAATTPTQDPSVNRTMLDFICGEAYAQVAAIQSLECGFESKDAEGWHTKGEFHADKQRFLVKRGDVTGMMFANQRTDPMSCISAFDGHRQQYLDHKGRSHLKTGIRGATYPLLTPMQAMYLWLQTSSVGPLRWDTVQNKELWEQRFGEATYIGAVPENGKTLEIVDFPQLKEGRTWCVQRVFFARDRGFIPVKMLRRLSATTETSTTMEVTKFNMIAKDGREFHLPLLLQWTETGADSVSKKQDLTMTVDADSIKINEPLDESLFVIPTTTGATDLELQNRAENPEKAIEADGPLGK